MHKEVMHSDKKVEHSPIDSNDPPIKNSLLMNHDTWLMRDPFMMEILGTDTYRLYHFISNLLPALFSALCMSGKLDAMVGCTDSTEPLCSAVKRQDVQSWVSPGPVCELCLRANFKFLC